jgi:hypothetical protein
MRTGSLLSLLVTTCSLAAADPVVIEVHVDPSAIRLDGPQASYLLLIHGKSADNHWFDLTRDAGYQSADPAVATVNDSGRVRAVADGSTTVTVAVAGKTLTVPVIVNGSATPRHFNFENDIIPLLSKFGCNSSGCHGKAEGQNGFKLSVFGFDPAADHAALTKEDRGRRVFPAAPEHSLLLAKMSGQVPHGGGVRIGQGSAEYETVRAWIAAGSKPNTESLNPFCPSALP